MDTTKTDSIPKFFTEFLMLSNIESFIFILVLIGLFALIWLLGKWKVKFGTKVMIAMVLGLGLGVLVQFVAGFPSVPGDVPFIKETTTWFSLFGSGYMGLIKMLVVPLVMVSIIHVIINMEQNAKIGKMVRNTIIVTMTMVAISAIIGLSVGVIMGVGKGMSNVSGESEIKEVKSIVATLLGLVPSNPVGAMVDGNIIALVIFSMFFGIGAKRMSKKYMDVVKPFFDIINALHKIIISVAMSIIKFMPYAVIPLLANTIASRGLKSIAEVGIFIVALYIALALTFVFELIAISIFGFNPIIYLKKSLHVMVLAFTSRSSVGCLPVTIKTLTDRLGVNDGTASFVASFGTTAGMQGCAGVFPALLIVFVANVSGIPIDATLLIMSVIVVSLGSLGIAGIPGTATMAASVALSGTGMAALYPVISPILAIDPLIDMGRTMINVTGSLTNALIVDRTLGQIDMNAYSSTENIDTEL